ncbi:putative baseplate assembly protein [Amycolatopsis sp. NPDC058986]|uniref:putative baseplate assembly protein n=1 Tax=unclassified Amycolatopsis TaxID=2618356 RepID=UPI0036707D2E
MSCDCQNDCGGCCAGVEAVTPVPSYNRPGLPALSYRAGTHGRFRESMLARLSSRRALDGLGTRDPDDPAIALLDCWALVGDVLTFYTERVANEGYLRTATEQESLDRLGRLVGYTPRPALGSTTYLAYTLDEGKQAVLPAGSAAKSVAEQGGLPQTFETTEELVARGEWNALAVRRTDPPDIVFVSSPTSSDVPGDVTKIPALTVAGTKAPLKGGDRLLFLFGQDKATGAEGIDTAVRVVKESKPDFTADKTAITLVTADASSPFVTAVTALKAVIRKAEGRDIVKNDPDAKDVDKSLLAPLLKFLEPPDPATPARTPADVLDGTFDSSDVPSYLDALRERRAFAELREGCGVRKWFRDDIEAVLTAGDALVALAIQLTRRTPDELTRLRRLARDAVCPPCHCGGKAEGTANGGCCCGDNENEDCDRAAALVALTSMLPALRKAPSRPPRKSRDLEVAVADQFRADADVHPKLLIAASPRLGPNLHRAWANEVLTAPLAVSDVQVLRVKAVTAKVETGVLTLDAVYEGILPGSRIVLETDSGQPLVALVTESRQSVFEKQVAAPTPTNPKNTVPVQIPVTVLKITGATVDASKSYVVWAKGEPLTPLGEVITDPVGGHEIPLERMYEGLVPGRWLVVSGERADVPHTSGVKASELAMLAGIRQSADPEKRGSSARSVLFLANDLAYTYKRDTVTLSANVVAATQGESRTERLGSGNSGQAGQTFRLAQVSERAPLTFSPSDNPLGAEDSLTVRVGGVAWHDVDSLIFSGPTAHDHTLRIGTDKTASVSFGDGVHGARLPSGTENVTAEYRTGAGSAGNVAAGKITQPATQPAGVTAVTNPVPATGGADGDGPADARITTPLRMLALDRLVSVRDYSDFTRARAGIGKADARKLNDGRRELVHVTIAGIGDVPIDPSSGLFGSLEAALARFGDLGVPVEVAVRDQVLIVLRAGIKVLPDYSWDLVQPAVLAAVRAELGFAARELGQSAYLSDVVSVIQAVSGVDYVDVDLFHGIQGDVSPLELATIVRKLNVVDTAIAALPARYDEVVLDSKKDGRFGSLTHVAQQHGLTVDELVALNPGLTGPDLSRVRNLTVFRGIRPAQLAVLPAGVPEALTLRRIP